MIVLLIVAAGLTGTILAILGRTHSAALVWLVPVAGGACWLTAHGQVLAPLALVGCWAALALLVTTPGSAR